MTRIAKLHLWAVSARKAYDDAVAKPMPVKGSHGEHLALYDRCIRLDALYLLWCDAQRRYVSEWCREAAS